MSEALCGICGEPEATTLITLGDDICLAHEECFENQAEAFARFPDICLETHKVS